ncbi:MAG: hypothetical protein ACJBCI_06765 [Candidatus Tisiphia sp.]
MNSMIFNKVAEKYGTKDKSAFKEYIHIIRTRLFGKGRTMLIFQELGNTPDSRLLLTRWVSASIA